MRVLPPALRSVSPRELAQRIDAERRGLPFLVHLDGDGRQRIVELGEAAVAQHRPRGPRATSRCLGHRGLAPARGARARGRRVDDRRRGPVAQRLVRQRPAGCAAAAGSATATRSRSAARCSSSSTRRRRRARHDDGGDAYLAPPELSDAQLRVLVALCGPLDDTPFAGPRSNREIADELFLSVETVKTPPARAVRAVRGRRPAAEPQARGAGAARVRDRRRALRPPALAARPLRGDVGPSPGTPPMISTRRPSGPLASRREVPGPTRGALGVEREALVADHDRACAGEPDVELLLAAPALVVRTSSRSRAAGSSRWPRRRRARGRGGRGSRTRPTWTASRRSASRYRGWDRPCSRS